MQSRVWKAHASRRLTHRAVSYAFVARTHLLFRDAERSGQLSSDIVGQRNFATFHASDNLCGYAGGSAKHRLREPPENPPVTGIPVRLRDLHYICNRDSDRCSNASEQVDLRRRITRFPSANGVSIEPGQARKFALRDSSRSPRFGQLIGAESAHHSSTHRLSPIRKIFIARHCAIPSLRCAHNNALRTIGLDSGRLETMSIHPRRERSPSR